MPKAWLKDRWEMLMPLLERLTVDQEEEVARICVEEIAAWKARPTMKSLSSLKEPMSDTRNRIREIPLTDRNSYIDARSGEREHIALKYLNYSESEWAEMNKPTEDRFHERLENQQDLEDSEAIVAKARELLTSKSWPDVVVGLAVVTGRRLSEIMKVGELHPKSLYTVIFSGQLKRKDEVLKPYEIPVLVEAPMVLAAWAGLRKMVDCSKMETEMIGKTYDKAVGEAAVRHFSGLVPVRDDRVSLFAHLFRDVYPCVAYFYFAPEGIHDIAYLPTILGHYWSVGGQQQRNYQSSLRYLAYRISDAEVYRHKGKRQGVRLDEPGVEILEVFKPKPVTAGGSKKKEQKVDLLETKKKHSATQLSQETKARLDQAQKDLGVRTQDEAMAAAIDSLYELRQLAVLLQPLYEQFGTDNPVGAVQALLGDGGAFMVDQKLAATWKTSLAEVVGLLEDAASDSGDKSPVVYLREMVVAKRTFKKSYEKRHKDKDYSKLATSKLRGIKMPGAQEERFKRAVNAIIKHNETVEIPEWRRYVSPALVVDLAIEGDKGKIGGRPSEAKEYIESRADVAEHHAKYGIKPGINRIPLMSVRLEVPEWPEGVEPGSSEDEATEETTTEATEETTAEREVSTQE
jgi:hypothetical protein